MKQLANLSFVARIALAMVLSLAINLGLGYLLKNRLSQKEYMLEVDVDYDIAATMELHYDTGSNFNRVQEVVKVVRKDQKNVQIPFQLKEGEQLKFLRLDFGNEIGLSKIELRRLSLSSKGKLLFEFKENQIVEQISLLQGITQDENNAIYYPDASARPFDPYVVFSPVNELIYPLWQRTLLLLAPWILLLFFPILNWTKERFEKKGIAFFLTALFLASIPLKIAWVTFTALLLLAFSLFKFAKHRKINFAPGLLAIMGLFLVPLFFLGNGEFAELAIPLGFVIFPIIFSILDISKNVDDIKKIYSKVFFVAMSIIIVTWILLMTYNGYFYNVDLSSYFTEIKWNAHLVTYWLYYPHTTFLSFFILIGGIFCLDLLKRQKIDKLYGVSYACLTIITLMILGSRFAWVLALLIPVLYLLPIQYLKRILIPIWLALFAGTVYFIEELDLLRTELWKVSFEEIMKNSWFGHGTGTSDNILPEELIIDKNGSDAIIDINHSHNQFLTYLLENGVLGTLLITALLLFIFYRFAKQNDKTMMLITFVILLLMVVESPFMTATPLYLISFLLCCINSVKKNIA